MRIELLVALCVASLLATACSKSNTSDENASAERTNTSLASMHSGPVVSREAGVRFDPPETWSRARFRVDTKSGDDARAQQPAAEYWVAMFYLPEQPGHKEVSLCRIVVFPRDDWLRIDAEPGPPVGTTIDSISTWVYVAQLPQSNPYPEGSPDAERFDAMRLSVEGEGPGGIGGDEG